MNKIVLALIVCIFVAQQTCAMSPLHRAASDGNVEEVSRILTESPDVINDHDSSGYTALHYAALNGHEKVVQILLDRDAEIDCMSHQKTKQIITPLICAVAGKNIHESIACLLINCGAYVNQRDHAGLTPLHYAAHHGNLRVTQELCEHGSDINMQDNFGCTPLHRTLTKYISELILGTPDQAAVLPGKTDQNRENPYELENKSENIRVASFLIDRGADTSRKDNYENTVLNLATHYSHTEIFKILIDHQAPQKLGINQPDLQGFTPLNWASFFGYEEMAQELIAHGANINNKKYCKGITPLHCALIKPVMPMMRFLMAKNADVHAKVESGLTPLHIATSNGARQIEATKMLLEAGANIN